MSEQASIQNYAAGPPVASPEFAPGRDSGAHPLRTVGIATVCLGVAALSAATFILSYSGIHAVVKQAGIAPRYASEYPLLIDAMLVITLLAVLALRGAGLPSRFLAWLTLLAVLGVAGGADALHATGRTLPHNVATATAAALPWALVLIAFLLLMAMLRHARLRRHANVALRRQAAFGDSAGRTEAGRTEAGRTEAGRTDPRRQVAARPEPLPVRVPQPWNSVSIVPGFSGQLVSSAAAGAAAAAAAVSESVSQSADPDAPGVGADVKDEVGSEPPGTPQPIDAESGPSVTEAADTPKVTDDGAAPGDPVAGAEDDGPTPSFAVAEPGNIDEEAASASDVTALAADGELPGIADPAPADQHAADPAPADQHAADPAPPDQGTADAIEDGMPVFHRMWSTPTPPDG